MPRHALSLDELLQERLPALLRQQAVLERSQRLASQVDGEIVGTGKADFTQDNVEYHFTYRGKTFTLVDVPGIEGNEAKYEMMVRAAVAKAHLVFYVNGTNKKPEVDTAKKIKAYLNRDAQVYAVCNIRGKGDSYEFPEFREALETTHADALDTLRQTQGVLGDVLGHGVLAGCQTLQGLLGFSSVAYDGRELTTIHPQRMDLLKSQRAYRQDFGSASSMRAFSKLDQLHAVIAGKCETFEADILESNKRKVLRLLRDTADVLARQYESHQAEARKITDEFEACEKAIRAALTDMDTSFRRQRAAAFDTFFTKLSSSAFEMVRTHFSDRSRVELEIREAAKIGQQKLAERLQTLQEDAVAQLSTSVDQALKRLRENAERVSLQQRLSQFTGAGLSLSGALDAIEFNFSDMSSLALNIGSYAATGFTLGTLVPGVGNIVGFFAGAAFGALMKGLSYWLGGRDKKIAEAQAKLSQAIREAQAGARPGFDEETAGMVRTPNDQVTSRVLEPLEQSRADLAQVGALIKQKLASIQKLTREVEGRGYGTV